MKFPVQLSFKLLALASQIYIRDADGMTVGYVKQKLLKLREDIGVYTDETRDRLLYNIRADRVLDFSARYNFSAADGVHLGSVKRQGMRSIWRANYVVEGSGGEERFRIREESGWVKVFDSLFGELPVIGMFSGYLFHPAYVITRGERGEAVARLIKEPAFFESKFQLEKIGAMTEEEEAVVLLAVLTMTLLERSRG
jgi:hypothetical protein